MAESAFNKNLREKLVAHGILVYRVESHGTTPGIPDNHWIDTADGLSGWMEVKESDQLRPTKVEYRPGQVPWLIEYSRAKGRCCTVLHVRRAKEVIWIAGRYAQAANVNLHLCEVVRLPVNPELWLSLVRLLRMG